MDIFVICTFSDSGRFVTTATPDEHAARAEADSIVANMAADGWKLNETQDISESAAIPGVPGVIRVYHLSRSSGVWENVEIYRIKTKE